MKSIVGCLGLGLSLFTGCSVETKASDIICIANQSDICTDCQVPDGDTRPYRGRHTCAADGKSFGACTECAAVDGPKGAEETVAATTEFEPKETPGTKVPIDQACTGKFTLVAGKDDPTSQTISAAVLIDGALKVFESDGAPMRSPGSFIVNGHSLIGVYRSKDGAIVTSTFTAGLWSKPSAIAGAKTDVAPAIALWGTKNKIVFHSSSGTYSEVDGDPTAGWSTPTVVAAPETTPATGTSAPSAVTVGAPGLMGGAIIMGFADKDGGLYREEWNGTSWKPPVKATIIASPVRSALVPLTGGKNDLLSAFVDDKNELYAATRSVTDSRIQWSGAVPIPDASPFDGANGVGLRNGRAILVFRDGAKKGWFSIFDPAKTPAWSAPAPLIKTGNPVLASLPQLAKDSCGAEASLAYAEENGKVGLLRFKDDGWDGPFILDGMTNMTYAGVAMVP